MVVTKKKAAAKNAAAIIKYNNRYSGACLNYFNKSVIVKLLYKFNPESLKKEILDIDK